MGFIVLQTRRADIDYKFVFYDIDILKFQDMGNTLPRDNKWISAFLQHQRFGVQFSTFSPMFVNVPSAVSTTAL